MYIYIYIHIQIHLYVYVYIYMYTYIHTACIYIYIYTHTYDCACIVYLHGVVAEDVVHQELQRRLGRSRHIYIYIYIYIYTYICTYNKQRLGCAFPSPGSPSIAWKRAVRAPSKALVSGPTEATCNNNNNNSNNNDNSIIDPYVYYIMVDYIIS